MGRRQTVQRLSQVGLVGGTPYHRDLMREWLADARCVLSITPIVDSRRQNGSNPANRAIDLVVGILDGPDDRALEDCRRLTDAGRSLPFVAVLLTPDRHVLQATLDAGAGGVVAAVSGPTSLADAVTAVAGGAAWLDPALSPIVMQQMGRPVPDDEFGLTPMEQRVAAYFPEGLTNREIADRLGIGEETVKSHVSNLYRKLDVCDRRSAVALLQDRLPRLQTTVTRPAPVGVGAA